MKIGIITYWNSIDNYGQQLQLFALQKYLTEKGHDPFLIRYDYSKDVYVKPSPLYIKIAKLFNPRDVSKYLQYRKGQKLFAEDLKNHPRQFEDFRRKYIKSSKVYTSLQELQQDAPVADIYITGSDQVWNFYSEDISIMRKKLHAYFLDFGPDNVRRMSYAASWGRSDISEDEKNEIRPLLEKFETISVREKSGVALCKQCGRDDCTWSCDPTLLLGADVYRNLYYENNVKKVDHPYVFFYYVDNGGSFNKESVYDFAKQKKLNVIYVSGNNNHDSYKKEYPTIPEWLYLLDNAEYVITNSFHCCIFSIIFNKKFACIPLNGKRAGMNTRIQSLFEICNLNERYFDEKDYSILDLQPSNMNIDPRNYATNLNI